MADKTKKAVIKAPVTQGDFGPGSTVQGGFPKLGKPDPKPKKQ